MTVKLSKKNRARTGAVALAIAGILAMPAASFAETLKMAWSADVVGLDPHKQTAFASLRLLELVYEPLVTLNADLEIVPAIAESWAFSDDGLSLTFNLNEQAAFHNGDKVTAADVKASYERILDEETSAATRVNFLSIADIETPDDSTVVFRLSQPDVPILTAMTDINAAILATSEIAADTIGTAAVGSGPFRLDEWSPNAKSVLSANADWWNGAPTIDGIEISVLPDETAILAALRSGNLDFALINDPLVASLIASQPNIELNKAPALSYHVLQLNASRDGLSELGVRQAISCALNRRDILDTASLGEGTITGPLTIPAYSTDPSELFCYEQDVAKAKQLMADAGADGLALQVIAAQGEPATAAAEAQVIQSQLAEIGIDVEIEMLELSVYIDRWLAADFDMAVAQNSGRADPFTMYNRYWTKEGNLQKVSKYIDDTLDDLMQQGRVETDAKKRAEIFTAFEKHITEMSPWVWLYNGFEYTAQQQYVDGFVPTPTDSLLSLSQVTINR